MKELKSKALKNSLIIAFLYVGLSTISVLSVYPSSPLHGNWTYVGLLLTIPISIAGFAVMFADPDAYRIVLAMYVLIFLIVWFMLYRELHTKYKEQRKV